LKRWSAFVRDVTGVLEDNRASSKDKPRRADKPATDVQGALTVIGRRAAIGTGSPDLGNAHIPKADLTGANLTDAYLKDAHLTAADLRGAT
jgi:uncharacterized protein YjbI with pentapeptide repeats